jgi:hypothetical protein
MLAQRAALVAALTLVVGAPRTARADSFTGLYDPAYSSDDRNSQTTGFPGRPIKHLVYPVLGFPSLVEVSGTIGVKVLLPDGGATNDWQASLETSASLAPEQVTLAVTGNQEFDPQTNVYTVEVQVPAGTLPGVYDLILSSASFTLTNGQPDRQPNAVRVLRPGRTNPSFVVIADSQLEDVRTTESPDRLRAMLAEIRLRDPDFCLFVGDMCFGSDYGQEYEQNWSIYSQSGLAIFYVPGNHDGYATVVAPDDPTSAPGELQRDGLNYWRRYIGPTVYSFDWLGLHFVGMNSMGGPPDRRNALGIVAGNYGGFVDPDALDWIEQDVANATTRGQQSVLFLHHDPSAALTPDSQAYPLPTPTTAFQSWNDAASQQRIESLVANQSVSHVLFGHIHQDSYAEVSLGGRNVPFVATTTLLCGHPDDYGYRVVQTSGGVISQIHYNGLKHQSVPFPGGGGVNIEADFTGPLDGSATTLDATVPNRLLFPVDVRLTLPVQPASGGLRARGAAVLESIGIAENGAWVARVTASIAAGDQVSVGVEPDPTGAGLQPGQTPSPATTTASVAPSPPTPAAPPASLAGGDTKNGPAITLTGPSPGTFTTDGTATVQGSVPDATVIASLTVNGDPVTVASDGSFSDAIGLATGLNVIEVEATDTTGRVSRQIVSVISGSFADPSQPIANAFAVRMNQGSLDAIAAVAQSKIGGDTLASALMARNPLYHGSQTVFGKTIVSAELNATSASFGTPSLTLSPNAQGFAVHAEIPSVDLSVEAHSFGGIGYSISGHLTADRATVDATISVSVSNGAAVASVVDSNVELENFTWSLDGFPKFLTGLATPLVRELIEYEVQNQVASIVPGELNKVIAGALGQPITHNLLETHVSLGLVPNGVSFDAQGENLGFDANVSVTPIPGFAPRSSPGSLVTGGDPPANGPGPGLLVSVNEDLLNRAGFAAWQSGLLDIRIDAHTLPTYHIPASLPLDTSFLTTFLPELQGNLPDKDPIALVIVPRLPPVFTVQPAPRVLEVGVGDLELDLYDTADEQNPALIVSLVVTARVDASVDLASDNHLHVSIVGSPRLESALLSSPLAPQIDHVGVSNLVDFSLPPLLEVLANRWPGIALPVQGSVVPANVSAAADGPEQTFVTVSGDP